ncbi:MAG: hypothetical protein E2O91_04005 [Alphaproteobacteria bacterium]|nr:MAG: hypothetical protein E2O91_04005 [Alphaproteobacteria bacterium]
MNFNFKYLWSGLTMFLLVAMGQPVFGLPAEQSSSQEKEQTPSRPPADTQKEDSLQSHRVLGNVPVIKRFTVTWEPGPVVSFKNGKFEAQMYGRVYWDYAVIKNSDRIIDINSSTFRAVRIGFAGRVGNFVFFKFEFDFAEKTQDLYVEWRGWADIKLGYYRFANPMERASGLAVLPFMERAALYGAFNLGRKWGISLAKTDELGMFEIGFGKGKGDNSKFSSPSNTIAARVNRAIPIEDGYVHLAGSITAQEIQENNQEFIFSAQPFQRQAPVLINTGEIASKTIFFGLEGGVFKGPFSLVSEVGFQKTTLTSPLPGQANPTFWGWHITATYFLTGEKNGYLPKYGIYARPEGIKSVWKGGTGAVQVAVRYDYIDLVDSGIFGGIQGTFIAGVNWWLDNHIKLIFDFSRSKITQAFLVPANGPDGANNVNTFGFRIQIDM